MKPKTIISLGAVGAIVVFMFLMSQTTPVVSDKEHTYVGDLTWLNSYQEGLQKAEKEDKPVVLYFWATWCKYCAKLNEEVFPSPEVNSRLKNNFVLVAINIDKNKEVTSKYGVQAPPAVYFVDSKGEVLTRVMGYTPKENFIPYVEEARRKYQ